MATTAPEQVIPGLTDLRSFTHILDFVSDRKKYSDRIAHLDAKTQECNEAVKRVVALNALGALQAQVRRDRQAADDVLTTAAQDAEKVRSGAQGKADESAVKTSAAEDALRLRTQTENERLSKWEKELDRREEITNDKKGVSEAELAAAEALHEKGLKLKERYGDALEALTKITNEV